MFCFENNSQMNVKNIGSTTFSCGDVINAFLLIFSNFIDYPILMIEEISRRAVRKTAMMEMSSFDAFLPRVSCRVMIPCPAWSEGSNCQ